MGRLLEPWWSGTLARSSLAKRKGPDATSARAGLTNTLRPVLALLRKTLTYERGKEMAEHAPLAQRREIQSFFADPDSPWPRGTNEHTKGLLCQDLPTGSDGSAPPSTR
ncbi:MAG: hypothetical protein ABI604_12895 [Nitrospirota bacterium]